MVKFLRLQEESGRGEVVVRQTLAQKGCAEGVSVGRVLLHQRLKL